MPERPRLRVPCATVAWTSRGTRSPRRIRTKPCGRAHARRASSTASTAPTRTSSPRSSCGTPAGTRSRCAISTRRRRATSCARCCGRRSPDGFLPHTILWHRPVRLSRRFHYSLQHASDRAHAHDPAAVRRVRLGARRRGLGRRSRLRRARRVAALGALHGWLDRERNPDGSGLVALISPDESGLDASPKFDALMGWRASGPPRVRLAHPRAAPRRVPARRRPAPRRLLRAGGADDRCARGLAARARAALGRRRAPRGGRARRGGALRALLGSSSAASSSTSPTPRASRSASRPGRASRRSPCRTCRARWRSGSPSTSPIRASTRCPGRCRPPRRASRHSAAHGPGAPLLARRDVARGHVAVHRGLRTHGFDDLARTLARQACRLVAGRGLREYYDPVDGTPQGAQHFGMSALVLDLERQR